VIPSSAATAVTVRPLVLVKVFKPVDLSAFYVVARREIILRDFWGGILRLWSLLEIIMRRFAPVRIFRSSITHLLCSLLGGCHLPRAGLLPNWFLQRISTFDDVTTSSFPSFRISLGAICRIAS
jgi:hypothetical protein